MVAHLAVIMDVFTRINRGWQISLGLGVELTLGALEQALKIGNVSQRSAFAVDQR